MIESIINKLADEFLDYENIDDLCDDYDSLIEITGKINDLQFQYNNQKEELKKMNFIKRLFKGKKAKLELAKLKSELDSLNVSLSKIKISDSEKDLVENYIAVVKLEDALTNGTLDDRVECFAKLFSCDFENVICFCEKNNISMFLSELDIDFLETFRNKYPSSNKRITNLINNIKKYSTSIASFQKVHKLLKNKINNKSIDAVDSLINVLLADDEIISEFKISVKPNDIENRPFSFEKALGDSHKKLGKYIDMLLNMNELDPEEVFAYLLSDTKVNVKNIDVLTRLKEMVISSICSFNNIYSELYKIDMERRKELNVPINNDNTRGLVFNNEKVNKSYKKLLLELIVIREIINSGSLTQLNVDRSIEYDLPIEYYDYSELLNKGKSLGRINSSNSFSNNQIGFMFKNYELIKIPLNKSDAGTRDLLNRIDSLPNREDEIINFLISYLNACNLEYNEEDLQDMAGIIVACKTTTDQKQKLSYIGFVLLYMQNNLERKKDVEQTISLN